nr:MAG TPA: hypothetical protein [Bacteriophage sp.]
MTFFSWSPHQNHIAKIRLCYEIRKCLCAFNIRLTYGWI